MAKEAKFIPPSLARIPTVVVMKDGTRYYREIMPQYDPWLVEYWDYDSGHCYEFWGDEYDQLMADLIAFFNNPDVDFCA